MELKTRHWIGIGLGVLIIIADLALFMKEKIFIFLLGIALLIVALPFIASTMIETGREKEKEDMFLEFSRNLVESVKAGTPISKSILNVKDKEYGSLGPHVIKLANQIALGIPVRQALTIFAKDVDNKVVSRSVALITEAEASGGKIDDILESTAKSVSEVEDIKKARKSSMYNTVVQLYIIFMIFLVIMIVMQIKFIPMIQKTIGEAGGFAGAGGISLGGLEGGASKDIEGTNALLNRIFLVLILVQGFFAGLVIGNLSEGSIKAGIKHSAIIVALAFLIITGAQTFFEPAESAKNATLTTIFLLMMLIKNNKNKKIQQIVK